MSEHNEEARRLLEEYQAYVYPYPLAVALCEEVAKREQAEEQVRELREALRFGRDWAFAARALFGIAIGPPSPSSGWYADEFVRLADAALARSGEAGE